MSIRLPKKDSFQDLQDLTISESPPLAHLFHECEWKDWVNQDYPANLWGQDGEYELRDRAGLSHEK